MTAIQPELMRDVTDLNSRLAQLPSDKMCSFADANQLIASDCDLQTVIDERVKAEADRIEKEKARIEAETKRETQKKQRQSGQSNPPKFKSNQYQLDNRQPNLSMTFIPFTSMTWLWTFMAILRRLSA